MPYGGLQIFGSGLRLQPVTPGVTDQGNAHISGTMIGSRFNTSVQNGMQVEIFGDVGTVNAAATGSVVIGKAAVLGPASSGHTVVGHAANIQGAGAVNCTVFGASASVNTSSGSSNTALGCLATITGGNRSYSTCVGANSGIGGSRSSVLGEDSNANNDDIVVGRASSTGLFDNVILLGNNLAATDHNQVVIGDSTHTVIKVGRFEFGNGVSLPLFKQTASAVVANTAVETALTAAGNGTLTIPANKLPAGTALEIRAKGSIGTTGTPTLRIRVKLAGVVILDTTAKALPAMGAAHTWSLDAAFTIRTAGAAGEILGNGIMNIATAGELEAPVTAPSAIDTTIANLLEVTAEWGTAAPANTITCTNLTVEAV